MNDRVMAYMTVTDGMSGPFYATFKEDSLVLTWAELTVNNDLIFEDVEYLGNDVYVIGKGMLVLMEWFEGKDFSSYKVEARERIST